MDRAMAATKRRAAGVSSASVINLMIGAAGPLL
jgi:hypothetical protein